MIFLCFLFILNPGFFIIANILRAEAPSEVFHVWNNDTVTVDIIDKHLRISPLRNLIHPEQLNREEVIAIWETSKKVASILEKVFGTRHYLEYSPIHHDGGQLFTEIIPVDGTSEFVDIAAKMHRNIYVISGGIHDHCQLTNDQIQEIQTIAEGILNSSVVVPGKREDNPGSWKIPWKNIRLAGSIVRETLAINQKPQYVTSTDSERKESTSIEGEFDVDEESDTIIRKVASCAFCRQQVIDNQRIIDGTWHHLVFNNKPFISEKHLMTVSKKHCLSREHLTEDEIWEEHQLFVRVGKVFQHMFGEKIPYCRFTQNGFFAGQTVPHPHTHFLAGTGKEGLNLWLKIVLKELEGNKEPPLKPEELQPIIEKYRCALDQLSANG